MSFALRFARHVERQGLVSPGDRVVVALSGGVDSLTLLHLLRFGAELPSLDLVAAHFDHAMREGSGEEARWVRGVCRAWSVPFREERASVVPISEEDARQARYAFLLRVVREGGSRWLLTAHHADDQAETVLFRIFRGTGLRGLAGIPAHRPPGIYRPLLPFSRREILAYAEGVGLRPRDDASNRDTRLPRNFLRHRILPQVEEEVAPSAREALVRLARLARENEEGWRSLLPSLLEGVVLEEGEGLVIVRSALLALHPAVRSRVLREALRRGGIHLEEAGTRALLEFTRTGASGRSYPLPGRVRFRRVFDRFTFEPDRELPEDRFVGIPSSRTGAGDAILGGRSVHVFWGTDAPEGAPVFSAAVEDLAFPLELRSWRPGDRMRLSYGTKKVKKLLSEARVPAGARGRRAVLCDALGRVLWVEGVASIVGRERGVGGVTFFLGIRDVVRP